MVFVDGLSQLFLPDSKSTFDAQKNDSIPAWSYTSIHGLRDVLASKIAAIGNSTGEMSQGNRTIVVLDAPDLLLAATAGSSQSVKAADVINMCLSLRSLPLVHSMSIAISGDQPLLPQLTNGTPLEAEHKTLLVSMAHQARMVLQLRPLESGSAKDISGVIRVSAGGAWEELDEERSTSGTSRISSNGGDRIVEGEWLYYITGSGDAKVWGRGETGLS